MQKEISKRKQKPIRKGRVGNATFVGFPCSSNAFKTGGPRTSTSFSSCLVERFSTKIWKFKYSTRHNYEDFILYKESTQNQCNFTHDQFCTKKRTDRVIIIHDNNCKLTTQIEGKKMEEQPFLYFFLFLVNKLKC